HAFVDEQETPKQDLTFEKVVQPFFAQNCFACHDEVKQTRDLNLEAFKTATSLIKDRGTMQMVLDKLKAGEMPPAKMPRPNPNELATVTDWLARQLAGAPVKTSAPAPPEPIAGHVTMRRLNRVEYDNTVRDLLGVDLHASDNFPQDDSGYGFDNIGDVLSLSPVLMEKYLAAAEKIARTAVFGPEQLKPSLTRLRPPLGKISSSTKPLFDYDHTGLSLPNAIHATYRFPVDAEYNIRIFLGGVRPAGSEPLQLALWIDGRQIKTASFNPDGIASFSDDRQDFGGMNQDFRTRVTAGDHWIAVSILRMYEGLPASYGGPAPSKRPEPPKPVFKPPRADIPPERLAEIKKRFEARM